MRAFIAASAIAEPVTPLISVDSAIDVWASPPFRRPVRTVASSQQVVRDARVVEEASGEDEQRNREQREVLRLGDRELDRDGGRQLRVLQEEQAPEMPIANATGMPSSNSTVKAIRTSSIRSRRRRGSRAASRAHSSRTLRNVVTSSSAAPTGMLIVTQE